MSEERRLICKKCGVELQKTRTEFHYLNSVFYHDVPACPVCGQVYIPYELATGKMKEVETEVEDK